jgi:hypothetical protein
MRPEAPWGELVALAEHERELALAGRWEEAAEASCVRLSASLALGPPPPAARPQLERLVELQAELTAGLSAARAFTAAKLGRMDRGHTALRGYGAGFAAAPPAVDSRG